MKSGTHNLNQEYVNMTEKEVTVEPPDILPKMKDPVEFNITFTIGGK